MIDRCLHRETGTAAISLPAPGPSRVRVALRAAQEKLPDSLSIPAWPAGGFQRPLQCDPLSRLQQQRVRGPLKKDPLVRNAPCARCSSLDAPMLTHCGVCC